jgi:hypothetical protein
VKQRLDIRADAIVSEGRMLFAAALAAAALEDPDRRSVAIDVDCACRADLSTARQLAPVVDRAVRVREILDALSSSLAAHARARSRRHRNPCHQHHTEHEPESHLIAHAYPLLSEWSRRVEAAATTSLDA